MLWVLLIYQVNGKGATMNRLDNILLNNSINGNAKKKDLRKRFLVSEGDLFQLYKEVMQVRNKEQKEAFMSDFRKLMREAQPVRMIVENGKKGGDNE